MKKLLFSNLILLVSLARADIFEDIGTGLSRAGEAVVRTGKEAVSQVEQKVITPVEQTVVQPVVQKGKEIITSAQETCDRFYTKSRNELRNLVAQGTLAPQNIRQDLQRLENDIITFMGSKEFLICSATARGDFDKLLSDVKDALFRFYGVPR